MRRLCVLAMAATSACSGTAWNTEVAATPASRLAMALSVIPGTTTETAFTTRWGKPTQKVREGGQTEFIYRDMRNPPGWYFPQFGDSHDYVIVTFQYGLAAGVRTSDGIDCRGTFPPRPPGPSFDNPATVKLVGGCAPPLSPEEAARKGPIATAWDKLRQTWNGATGPGGRPQGGGTGTAGGGSKPPGVVQDSYDPSGKAGRTGGAAAPSAAASEPVYPVIDLAEPDAPGPVETPVTAGAEPHTDIAVMR